jgi:hypothetical protein
VTPEKAKQIIDVLAVGVDPVTGEVLSEDNPLNDPQVIRALFIAAKALERMIAKPARHASAVPAKAGESWSEDENRNLLAGFDAGTPVTVLARTHERTSGAITSRLIRLGRLQVRRQRQDAGEPDGGAELAIESKTHL